MLLGAGPSALKVPAASPLHGGPRSCGPHSCSSLPKGCFSRPHLITTCFCLTLSVAPVTIQKRLDPVISRIMAPKDGLMPMPGI